MIKLKTNLSNYHVKIYQGNKLINSAIANKGYCQIFVNNFGGYLLKLFVGSTLVMQSSIFYNDDNFVYVIYINQKERKKVILKLIDHNYNDLMIEKGYIYLWHIMSK